MNTEHHVDSGRNPLIKALARLKDRRGRDRAERYLVEGAREATRAIDGGVSIEHLLVCPQLAAQSVTGPLASRVKAAGGEVVTTSLEAFQRLSVRANPDGVIAVAVARPLSIADLPIPTDALLLVVDGLEKPGNVGALLRTADAVGVDAVFMTGEGTDLYNPNVIRSSMGSLFALPVAVGTGAGVRARLVEAGVRIITTSPSSEMTHWQASYVGATAVVLGPEHQGLDRDWFEVGHHQVKVPMRGRLADSLNVSVAGAVILYEAMRQRSPDA